ncbi:TRIM7 ligase, partial [Bucco capensis]|nr:TRIM7 ligase [Bucco capensis]
LSLDVITAHPRLLLTADQQQVSWAQTLQAYPEHPKRFDSSRCILSHQGFQQGRHFWHVQVTSGEVWALGLAKESLRRKGRVHFQPELGIWALGRCGEQYQALTSPPSILAGLDHLQVVGIYLDYEEGQVVFWDVKKEVVVFTYSKVIFGGEKVFP